jgi:DNA-binding HxlR family transcriptional regulator
MDSIRARLSVEFDCPLYLALAILGGRWKPLILWHLLESGPQRFLALQRTLRGVPRKVLSQQLKEMIEDGLVWKTARKAKVPHCEYGLTVYGRSVSPVLDALCAWGEAHQAHATSDDTAEFRDPRPRLPAVGA